MLVSYSYKDLRDLSDEELIDAHDSASKNVVPGVSYFLDELSRRESGRVNASMLRCTKWITVMTAVMLVCTVINVVIAVIK